MLGLQGRESRREILAKASAALASVAAVQSASAKAGQFSKIDIFSVIGEPSISSPYQPGGPKGNLGPGGIEKGTTTYGYAKSDGPILANGFREDVTREKAQFLVSVGIVKDQKALLDKKTWWLVRDNLRTQVYNMKANMRAINAVAEDKTGAKKAYDKFVLKLNSLDLACVKKEYDLAQKEYADLLDSLA